MSKVTAEQMRDQISNVQRSMNSVKSCASGDNKIAEKKFLENDLVELEAMTLARKNPELSERQATWIREGRELLATTGDVAPVLGQDPEVLAASLELLRKIGM